MEKETTDIIISALEKEKWAPRLNTLKRNLEISEDLPWRPLKEGTDWKDDDWNSACTYLRLKCGDKHFRQKTIRNCIIENAKRIAYHPILTPLDDMEPSEESALDTLLSDFLGAKDSDLNRAILEYVLVNAYWRMKGKNSMFFFNLALLGDSPDTVTAFLDKLSLGNNWIPIPGTSPDHSEHIRNVFVEFKSRPLGTEIEYIINQGKYYPKVCTYVRNTRFLEYYARNSRTADIRDLPIHYDVSKAKRTILDLTPELALTVWKEIEDRAKDYDDEQKINWILKRIEPKKQQLLQKGRYKRANQIR